MQPLSCSEVVHRYLGETIGFWVQTLALGVSAVAAIYLILDTRKGIERQIRAASLSTERRATIELILSQNTDSNLTKAKRLIESLLDCNAKNFAVFLQDRTSVEYVSFVYLLNTYEFIAAAVRERALDEELLKRMQCTVILKNWGALEPFVLELRRQDSHPTLFQEIQLLAERWRRLPLISEV